MEAPIATGAPWLGAMFLPSASLCVRPATDTPRMDEASSYPRRHPQNSAQTSLTINPLPYISVPASSCLLSPKTTHPRC